MSARLVVLLALGVTAGCGPGDPCHSSYFRRITHSSRPYAGDWAVGRGDTLTLPSGMGDRFRLAQLSLDTTPIAVERACRYRGALLFAEPTADTLAITWFGEPEHAIIFGWPAELGPFAGIELRWWGRDSLRGALLFDERLNVRLEPGVTAQFVAGRARH